MAIAGRVVDGGTSKPVVGAEVTILSGPAEFGKMLKRRAPIDGATWTKTVERPDKTRSRIDGLFYFVDLPDGKYDVRALLPDCGKRYGEARQTATVSLNDTEMSGQKYLKKIWINLVLPPTAVRGKVIDPAQKAGVCMAEVRVKGSGERAFSDAQGQFRLGPIEPGKRVLQASAQGYVAKEKEVLVVVKVGQQQEAECRLERRRG